MSGFVTRSFYTTADEKQILKPITPPQRGIPRRTLHYKPQA